MIALLNPAPIWMSCIVAGLFFYTLSCFFWFALEENVDEFKRLKNRAQYIQNILVSSGLTLLIIMCCAISASFFERLT